MTGRYYLNNIDNKNNNYYDKTGYSNLFLTGSKARHNNFYYKEQFKSSTWFGQIVKFKDLNL